MIKGKSVNISIKEVLLTIYIEPMYIHNIKIGTIKYVKLFCITIIKVVKID